jgi:hypothetical protein
MITKSYLTVVLRHEVFGKFLPVLIKEVQSSLISQVFVLLIDYHVFV